MSIIEDTHRPPPTTTPTGTPPPPTAGGGVGRGNLPPPPPTNAPTGGAPGGGTPPPPSTSGTDPWNTILNGRNPFGTNGAVNFDVNNHAPNQWFTGHENSEGGWAWDPQSSNPRLALSGNTVLVDGNFVPIGGMQPDARGRTLIDPNNVTYDPEFGMLTPTQNIRGYYDTRAGDLSFAFGLGAMGVVAAPFIGAALGSGVDIAGPPASQAPFDFTPLPPPEPPPVVPDPGTPFVPDVPGAPPPFNFDPLPPPAPPPTIPQLADGFTPDINNLINGVPPPGDIAGPPASQAPYNFDPLPPPGAPPTVPDLGAPFTPTSPTWYDRLLDRVTGDPLRALGTAATVGNLIRGGRGNTPGTHQNTPITDPNNTLAPGARDVLSHNGAPTNDQRATIDATIEEQFRMGREAILQASVNSGMGGKDSMVTQDKLRSFRQQLETMRLQMYMKQAEQNVLDALNTLGLISKEQYTLAEIELRQNTQAQNRAMSIMQSLGWLWSASSGSTSRGGNPSGGANGP